MDFVWFILLALLSCSVTRTICLPVRPGATEGAPSSPAARPRSLWKRFIDTSSDFGAPSHGGDGKMRTRRSEESEEEERCEQLRLCRLHARSASSFMAAFELYFVKENARLWDHRARSPADCERRFRCDR